MNTHNSLRPVKLNLHIKYGNNENEFKLKIDSAANEDEDEFNYEIRCLDEEIQLKIQALIDKWVRKNKPSRLLSIWSNCLSFVWIILFITFLISLSGLTYTSSSEGVYKEKLKEEAYKYIEAGTNDQNRDSVIILLLKLQANYVPESIKSQTKELTDPAMKKLLIASIFILLASLIRPKTIIGIGKNYMKYKLYKIWIYCLWSILSLLATALIADSFLNFIK